MVKINDCCQNCGKSGSQLRNCKRCKVVFYCSDICEMEDRDEHSRVCSVEKVASANADFDEQNIKSKKDKQTGDAKKDNDGAGNDRNDYNNVPSFSSMEVYNDMGHLSNPYGFVAGATTRFNHPFQCLCCGGLKFNPVFCKRCRFTSYCSEQCLLRDFFTHCLECIPCDKRECARCSRSNVELTKCSGCNTVEYCSKLCENAAWEHHKLSCKTSKTKGDENSSKISIKGQCARCKKSDAVLKKCSGCNIVEYCSRACQSVDWTDHKTSCKRSVKSQCARCKKSGAGLKKCSGCNSVEYCSRICQTTDWEQHKTSCKKSVKGQCARCKKSGVALKKCVACNNVEYCSKVCQTADWEHHKNSCKPANTEDGESSSKIPIKGRCGKCKRSNVKLIKCPACDNIEYCSQVCQIADWTDHRKSCQISESKGECANCSRSMRKCSGCNSVEYCSKECESAHWKHHKTSCKPSKAEADDSSPSEKSVKSKCGKCKKSDVALKKCFQCNNVEYCSEVCREDDWEHHKTSCKTSKTADGASSSKTLINERCQRCKCWNDPLKYCTGCHEVKYCSKYCQKTDWLFHRENCNSAEMPSPTGSRKGSTFPIPESVNREIARMFPFQRILTRFDEVTAVDKLPLTHSPKEERFIAYIFKKGEHSFRLHHEIRDVIGEIRHVMFYLTEFISEPYFRWNQLKVGNYIVIIKPQIHYFIDGRVGFRVDSLKQIRFIDNSSH